MKPTTSFRTLRAGTSIVALAAALGLAAALHLPTLAPEVGEVPVSEARLEPAAGKPSRKPGRAGLAAASGDDFRRFASLVEKASRDHGVDAALVHAVIFAESSYDPDARSPAGAAGLMQLMPITARHYGVRDLFDPQQNIQGGVKFLRDLLHQFDGNLELALAAYNAGTTAVIRAGHRIPPLAETQAYVPKVIDHYHRLRAAEG